MYDERSARQCDFSKLQCPSKRMLVFLKGTDEGPDASGDASVEFYTEKECPIWWNEPL